MTPTTSFNINYSLWIHQNDTENVQAAGVVAGATASKKKQEKGAIRGPTNPKVLTN
jgi:hypothetical protein